MFIWSVVTRDVCKSTYTCAYYKHRCLSFDNTLRSRSLFMVFSLFLERIDYTLRHHQRANHCNTYFEFLQSCFKFNCTHTHTNTHTDCRLSYQISSNRIITYFRPTPSVRCLACERAVCYCVVLRMRMRKLYYLICRNITIQGFFLEATNFGCPWSEFL